MKKRQTASRGSLAGGRHQAGSKGRATLHKRFNGPTIRRAFALLLRAYEKARRLKRSTLDHAIPWASLDVIGLGNEEIEVLCQTGCVEHHEETTLPGKKTRRFCHRRDNPPGEMSCFVLTERGVDAAYRLVATDEEDAGASLPPHWLADLRELWFRQLLVKRFLHTAPCQEVVLAAFQQALNITELRDPKLIEDLERAAEQAPRSAGLHHALGLVRAWRAGQPTGSAASAIQQAWVSDPSHVLAGLNLAEMLFALGQKKETVEQCERTLAMLDRLPELDRSLLDGEHYPNGFDDFRVGWEKAAWEHAGDEASELEAKRSLLRRRLHTLMGEVTGDTVHLAEAALCRPDLPASHSALGHALARQGRWREASGHLRRGLGKNPFDRDSARTLFGVLGQLGERSSQDQLADDYRRISQAAPSIMPAETWFMKPQGGPKKLVQRIGAEEFRKTYGLLDTNRAIHGFTPPEDAVVVLTLLAHIKPKRIVEIGTAAGHMTANLSQWSPEEARVFSIGVTAGMASSGAKEQRCEDPSQESLGRERNHFGKGHKVTLIVADSLSYDFGQIGPVEFAFIDGAHDYAHVRSDSLNIYEALAPGGLMVWHDFNSPSSWVAVRQVLEELPFPEPIFHVEGTQVAFLRKGSAAVEPVREPLRIIWEGGFAAMHSLSLVNRELTRMLVQHGHELSLRPTQTVGADSALLVLPAELQGKTDHPLSGPPDVFIAHQWPPSFRPPAEGHWVIMQPWEFGSLPKAWIAPMASQADELWVPSHFVRDCFIKSGIPTDRVAVIPLGIHPDRFETTIPPLALKTQKKFKFLFVGGTINRKGIDALLRAYQNVFSAGDEVCLVIKDMGVGTFYRNQTAERLVAELRSQPQAPEIEYIDRELSQEEMAGLYLACDCLVHPFRGEGFGLPILEAMAHGLPVIVTGYGPVLDYASEETAYFLPAREVRFSAKRVDQDETVDYPWLVEPDMDQLRYWLRHVVEHPEEARAKGERARRHVLENFSWEQSVAAVEARLHALRQRPIQRQMVSAPVIAYGAAANRQKPRVTLAMIVRNEESCLERCLKSAADLVDQIVVVDSGSIDRTKEIAARFGAKVVDFSWVDSFAAARNESLKHATGDWILWLDADEYLDEPNRQLLRQLLAQLENPDVAYLMQQHSKLEGPADAFTAVHQVRLFRNFPGLGWQHRVHEQILPSLRGCGVTTLAATGIVISHSGFADPKTQGPKVDRNLRLLQLELIENPNDAFVLFNLGSVSVSAGRHDEGIDFLRRSLGKAQPHDTFVPKIYALLVRAYLQSGRKEEAGKVCQEGRQAIPGDGELLFHEAILRHDAGDLEGAIQSLQTILACPRQVQVMGSDAGLHGYRTRNFLAQVYADQGKLPEAEKEWAAAVGEQPRLTIAWKKLAELWLAQKRFQELETAVRHIHQDPASTADATVLWCRALLAQGDFANARGLLARTIENNPGHVPARIVLSHVLLQEGADMPAAEQALRNVLAVDPGNGEAARNLHALLRSRDGRPNGDGQELPAPSAVVYGRPAGPRPRVSLCMIVKNEEDNLADCLASVADLADEIVIVDTGSTDRTKEIAARFGAIVVDFPWIDSFAAARNEGLKHATGDWVLWMDADDRLDEENRNKLRQLIASLPGDHAGYVMTCLCVPNNENKIATAVNHVRLFRRLPGMQWKRRVHEQILEAIRKNGGSVGFTQIVVYHVGYKDGQVRRRKLERDLRLLLMEQAEQPEDPFTLFNLGSVYQEMGKVEEALPFFIRSLRASCSTDSIVAKLYALIGQSHNQLGRHAQAIAACKEGRMHYPKDVELLFQEGIGYRHLNDLPAAVRCWEEILRIPEGAVFASLNTGIRGYLTRHNLAVAYTDLGQFRQAEEHWQAVLAERPDYPAAWGGLAEIAVREQRWDRLEELVSQLRAQGSEMEAGVFAARMHLTRKEFSRARGLLETTIGTHPQAIWPRVVLTHVLLQERRDWAAAEKALRDVLALDPDHQEAKQNLAVLLREHGPAAA